jgi:hypothetical protein
MFCGIFLGISWGSGYFETFSAENSNFPQHVLGEKFPRKKIAANIAPPIFVQIR